MSIDGGGNEVVFRQHVMHYQTMRLPPILISNSYQCDSPHEHPRALVDEATCLASKLMKAARLIKKAHAKYDNARMLTSMTEV